MARRALILATGSYDDPELTPLASPVPDGLRLRDLFIRTDVGGYEVIFCENPDLRTARLAIEDFFDDGQRDDLNFVLISGHGLRDGRGNLYFAMRDTRSKRRSATGLDAHYVRERMRDSRTRQQILCIDTCFSGAFPHDMVPKSGTLSVRDEDLGADGATGTAFIMASDSISVALEREVAGRTQSVFTRHLIEGIESGAADTQGDGRILLDELFLYVKNQVIAEIPTQTPKIINGFDGPIAIARNPNYRAVELPDSLIEMAKSKDRVQRGMAIEQLHELVKANGREASLALSELRRLARDDSNMVRLAALESLDELTGQRVVSEPPVVDDEGPDPEPYGLAAMAAMAERVYSTERPFAESIRPMLLVSIALVLASVIALIWYSSREAAPTETRVEAGKPMEQLDNASSIAAEMTSPATGAKQVANFVASIRPLKGRWYPVGQAIQCSETGSDLIAKIEVLQDGNITLNGKIQVRGSATMDDWQAFGDLWFLRSDEKLLIAQKPENSAAGRYLKCP